MPVVTVINFYFTLNNFRVHRIITPIRSKVRKITKANLAKLVLPDLLPDIRHCINYRSVIVHGLTSFQILLWTRKKDPMSCRVLTCFGW